MASKQQINSRRTWPSSLVPEYYQEFLGPRLQPDAGTARAMLLASEMEFHEPVTEGRDERWCCGKRAQQWVCIHPCLCGLKRLTIGTVNDVTARYTQPALHSTATDKINCLYTRVAACADIGEGCDTRKVPQEIEGCA
jgi:hypothetical protein